MVHIVWCNTYPKQYEICNKEFSRMFCIKSLVTYKHIGYNEMWWNKTTGTVSTISSLHTSNESFFCWHCHNQLKNSLRCKDICWKINKVFYNFLHIIWVDFLEIVLLTQNREINWMFRLRGIVICDIQFYIFFHEKSLSFSLTSKISVLSISQMRFYARSRLKKVYYGWFKCFKKYRNHCRSPWSLSQYNMTVLIFPFFDCLHSSQLFYSGARLHLCP